MWKRLMVITAVLVLASAPSAYAQRVEASVFFGWTLSDGASGDAILAGDGEIYDTIDVKDSASWGFSVGGNVSENYEVGFQFMHQMSTLSFEGTAEREVGDLAVYSYHPYFAYNMGPIDARVRPFFLIGLGATQYGSVEYVRVNPTLDGETEGNTQFSTTWAVGVKVFPGPNVGFRAGLHWTPTYLTSEASGMWCDPYWGCYVVGEAKYSNQFSFNGGIAFRF